MGFVRNCITITLILAATFMLTAAKKKTPPKAPPPSSSPSFRVEILGFHNTIRRELAAGHKGKFNGKLRRCDPYQRLVYASDMYKLRYSSKLEAEAKKKLNAAKKRCLKSKNVKPGELVAQLDKYIVKYKNKKPVFNFKDAMVDQWLNEYKPPACLKRDLHSRIYNPYNDTNHFGQLINGETKHVGCAVSDHCKTLLCRHNPPQEAFNATLFTTASTCSLCKPNKCEKTNSKTFGTARLCDCKFGDEKHPSKYCQDAEIWEVLGYKESDHKNWENVKKLTDEIDKDSAQFFKP